MTERLQVQTGQPVTPGRPAARADGAPSGGSGAEFRVDTTRAHSFAGRADRGEAAPTERQVERLARQLLSSLNVAAARGDEAESDTGQAQDPVHPGVHAYKATRDLL